MWTASSFAMLEKWNVYFRIYLYEMSVHLEVREASNLSCSRCMCCSLRRYKITKISEISAECKEPYFLWFKHKTIFPDGQVSWWLLWRKLKMSVSARVASTFTRHFSNPLIFRYLSKCDFLFSMKLTRHLHRRLRKISIETTCCAL